MSIFASNIRPAQRMLIFINYQGVCKYWFATLHTRDWNSSCQQFHSMGDVVGVQCFQGGHQIHCKVLSQIEVAVIEVGLTSPCVLKSHSKKVWVEQRQSSAAECITGMSCSLRFFTLFLGKTYRLGKSSGIRICCETSP